MAEPKIRTYKNSTTGGWEYTYDLYDEQGDVDESRVDRGWTPKGGLALKNVYHNGYSFAKDIRVVSIWVFPKDPKHPANQQPSFTYFCTRGNKQFPNTTDNIDLNLFNSIVKTIVADKTNPFWSQSPVSDAVYKKWTCVHFDLSQFVGETVSICFYVQDCAAGGHFGYIYMLMDYAKKNI